MRVHFLGLRDMSGLLVIINEIHHYKMHETNIVMCKREVCENAVSGFNGDVGIAY